jgi:hypothetical protein
MKYPMRWHLKPPSDAVRAVVFGGSHPEIAMWKPIEQMWFDCLSVPVAGANAPWHPILKPLNPTREVCEHTYALSECDD